MSEITPAIPGIEDRWYREIVETAPDATVMIDSEGVIVLVNKQTETLFGYGRQELLGQPIETLVPQRYRHKHHVHRDGYFTEPNVREMGAGLELSGVRKDGTEFPVEISLSPLRTDRGVFATAAIRDATTRRAADEQFRNLLETAPDAMIIINREGNIVLVNAQAERMFGYKREALIGKPVEALVPERLRDQHLGHRTGYFTDPKVREMGAGLELSGRRKDGSEFPIEISLSPLETEDGSLATAAVRDITDRKKVQEQMRNLLETAPDAMVIIDQKGIITLINKQTELLFGHTRDSLIGQPVEVLVPERLRAHHIGHRTGYFTDPKVREMGAGLDLWGARADGTEFPIEISLSPLDTEEGRFATAAVRDITDRKTAQDAAQQLAAIVESSTDAILGKMLDGTITSWNKAAEDLYGYKAAEIIGKSVRLIVPEDKLEELDANIAKVSTDSTVDQLETARINKDGKRLEVSLTISPIHNSEGQVVGASTISRDIGVIKKAHLKFEALLETAPDAMVIIDKDGLISLINRQTEQLFGYGRAELVGQSVEILVPERLRDRHLGHRTGYFHDPNVREMGAGLELSGRRKDGTEFPIEISLSPLDTEDGTFATAAVRDITDRKKAAEQFKNLLETAPDAMIIIEKNGLINLVNQQAEHLFGYSRKELIGQPVEILVPETLRDRHVGHRDGYFVDPKVRGMGAGLELSGRRKDGTEFPIEISLSPLEPEDGRFATAAVRDITDRKKSQEQIRDLLETAPDAMVIINQKGIITLVNRQTERLFGHTRDALVGQSVEILVPQRLRDQHVGHRTGYFTDPKVREMGAGLELWGSRADGTEFPIEISLSPLETEEGRFATAAVRDITDRKKAQAQFKNLLETAPDAMIIIDRQGIITLVNQQTERVFGYERAELIDKPVEILVPHRLRKKHEGHRTGYFHDPNVREMGAGLELSGLRKDGSEFPIEISLSPLETQDGHYATAAVRDITDRKTAQVKLTDYARNLEASNRELEEFAYVASHDLQAPLRNIISFSELLHDECVGKISPEADEYFGFIEEGALRLQGLIKDILEVSRVNRMERSFATVDLNECLETCRTQLRSVLEEASGRILFGKLPDVKGDALRLAQLFQNLLNNAVKFQSPGVAPQVNVSAKRDGDFWEFSVTDNGIGIAPDECAQVFEIFRRLHTADEYPGTGIGLSICKKIVETHGGHIWVESQLGEGATFKFTLPDVATILPPDQPHD